MSKSKPRKAPPTKKPVIGYGWTSQWIGGKLGWWMPCHLHGGSRRYSNYPTQATTLDEGDRLYLCKITVEPVTDKRGRFITRIPKRKGTK